LGGFPRLNLRATKVVVKMIEEEELKEDEDFEEGELPDE
jgi:hypothetical protein